MAGLRIYRTVFLVLLACCAVPCLSSRASAQSGGTTAADTERANDVDLEFQLHLLVASNVAGDNAKLSAPLESVARELRPLLPFTNYRLGATFLGRVKNGKPINMKGVGRTLLVTPALEASVNPTFYEISGTVILKTDAAGREVVQMSPFRFGLRIPLQGTLPRANAGSDDNSANILYEGVGITTDVSVREGEPIIVGTLDAGRPNETLVLVFIAKRAAVR
jgi:hypothetical protein